MQCNAMQALSLPPGALPGVRLSIVPHGSRMPYSHCSPNFRTLISVWKDKPLLRFSPLASVASKSRQGNLDSIRTPSSRVSATANDCSCAKLSSVSLEDVTRVAEDPHVKSHSILCKAVGLCSFGLHLVCSSFTLWHLFILVVNGKAIPPFAFWMISIALATAFVAAFLTMRYIQLSEELRKAQVSFVDVILPSIMPNIHVNSIGLSATFFGILYLLASVVSEALTQGISLYASILPLDVQLVQILSSMILAHAGGFLISLQLLRFFHSICA